MPRPGKLTRRTRLLALIIAGGILAAPQTASAAGKAGDLDPTFNGGAPVLFDLAKTVPRETTFLRVAADGAGRIIATGLTSDSTGRVAAGIARVGSDGLPDPGFGEGGGTQSQFGAGPTPFSQGVDIFPIPGRYMGIAVYRSFNGRTDQSAYAFGTAGGPEFGFGNGAAGLATQDTVKGHKLNSAFGTAGPDGSVYISGTTELESSKNRGAAITKFTPQGQLTTGFGGLSSTWTRAFVAGASEAYGGPIAVIPGDKLVMAAANTVGEPSEGTELALVQVSASTAAFDKSFGEEEGITIYDVSAKGVDLRFASPRRMVIGPDGEIYVAGIAEGAEEEQAMFVARFTPGGLPDRSFGVNGLQRIQLGGVGQRSGATDMVLQPDGKVVVAAYVDSSTEPTTTRIVRLQENGSLDPSFGNGGTLTPSLGGEPSGIVALTLTGDRLAAAGYYTQGARQYGLITRFLLGPLPDAPPSAGPKPRGALRLQVRSLKVDAKGHVSLPLTCSAAGPCTGALALVAASGKALISKKRGPKKAATFAKGRYSLAAGAKKKIVLTVKGGARKKARSKKGLRARLAIASSDGPQSLTRVSLHAKK